MSENTEAANERGIDDDHHPLPADAELARMSDRLSSAQSALAAQVATIEEQRERIAGLEVQVRALTAYAVERYSNDGSAVIEGDTR